MTNNNRHGSTNRGHSLRRPWSTLVACWVGLVVWLGASAAWAQFLPLDPTQVVINAAGGTTNDDGLRIYLGNLGGIQVVRAGSGQYYGDVPTGPEGVNNGFFMAVGAAGAATVYGPQLDIDWDAIAWTPVSQSEVTGQGTAEDPYQVVTIVSAGGFRLAQTVRYVVPNVYFEVRLTLVPPVGNTQDVRIYHWLDTFLNGGDYGPAFSQPASNPTVVGVAKGGQYELLIQGNRAWNAYFSGVYYRPGELIELGGSLDNTLDTDPDTDNGIAAQWDIAAPTGPVTWTYRLATVQVNDSTCGDGEITGYEGCDDGGTDNGDGCSSICQVEVGYTCIGAPSNCQGCFVNTDCDDGNDCTLDSCSNNSCGHTTALPGSMCLTGMCNAGGICVDAPPAITSANATAFTVGTAGTFTVTTSGTQIVAISTASPLPSDVTLVDNGNGTATLTGTPAAGTAGTYPLTITADNGVPPNADQNFTLSVNQAPAITSANATTFTVGTAGTFTVTTSGTPSAAISTASPLPAGITLVDNGNGTATLAGTAAYGQGGVYTLSIAAANGVNPPASQTFTLTVTSVTSFSGPTATGTGTATAVISGGGVACTFLGDAAFIKASSVGTQAPVQFPHGLFTFTLRGCTGPVTLTITYPSVLPRASAYWKYGPQSKGATSTWYQFVAAPTPASAIYRLTLTNNALGDDDWDATTDIVDQGGPGASAVAVPTPGAAGLTLLACLLAVAGLLMLRMDAGVKFEAQHLNPRQE
jgi:cysteine-rich repeat protein